MDTTKGIIYIVSGLFIISCLFCIASLSYTSLENVSAKSLEEKIANRKTELEIVSNEAASLSEWINIKEYFAHFKTNYFMKMEEFSRFRDELQGKFNQYGLNTRGGVDYKYKRIFKDYIRVELTFTATSSYPNIKRFIREIAEQKKMILIKNLQLSKTDRGDIAVKCLMEVYLVG
jgi:protein involved in sex pheromone biosynthesis